MDVRHEVRYFDEWSDIGMYVDSQKKQMNRPLELAYCVVYEWKRHDI